MTTTVLKRQFITDAVGNPIGVILPIEEFKLVRDVLDQRLQSTTLTEADKLDQIEQAASDPLFMADLQETMDTFAEADQEWWEPTQ